MPGRKFVSGEEYRFGFNGKEDDRDWGTQNIQDYGFRLYNPSIGKFLSVDPLSPDYPWYTPYQFAGNKPIQCIDLDGLEEHVVIQHLDEGAVTTISIFTYKDAEGNILDQDVRLKRGKSKRVGRKVTESKILVVNVSSNGKVSYEGRSTFSKLQKFVYDNVEDEQGLKGGRISFHGLEGNPEATRLQEREYIEYNFLGAIDAEFRFMGDGNNLIDNSSVDKLRGKVKENLLYQRKESAELNSTNFEKLAEFLAINPDKKLLISGVTPASATEKGKYGGYYIDGVLKPEATGLDLANARAQAIIDKLVNDFSIDRSRLEIGEHDFNAEEGEFKSKIISKKQ